MWAGGLFCIVIENKEIIWYCKIKGESTEVRNQLKVMHLCIIIQKSSHNLRAN